MKASLGSLTIKMQELRGQGTGDSLILFMSQEAEEAVLGKCMSLGSNVHF